MTIIQELLKTHKINKHGSLHILENMLVKDEKAYVTNLDYNLILGIDLPDGIYNIAKYIKTEDADFSREEIEASEFPDFPKLKTKSLINLDLAALNSFFKYAELGGTRESLGGVHVSKIFMEATNGHILKRIEQEQIEDVDIIIPDVSRVLKIIDKAGVKEMSIKTEGEVQWLEVKFNGGIFQVQTISPPYPDVDRVLPDSYKSSNFISNEQRAEIAYGLDCLIGYGKNCIVLDDCIFNCDREKRKKFIFQSNFKLSDLAISFDIQNLKTIISDFDSGITFNTTNSLSAAIFTSDKQLSICMPLKFGEAGDALDFEEIYIEPAANTCLKSKSKAKPKSKLSDEKYWNLIEKLLKNKDMIIEDFLKTIGV